MCCHPVDEELCIANATTCDVLLFENLVRVVAFDSPEEYYSFRDHIYADFSYMHVNDLGCMEFAGGYPKNLHEEINNYSIIAGVVARRQEFDIIHAHDWLTYPALH